MVDQINDNADSENNPESQEQGKEKEEFFEFLDDLIDTNSDNDENHYILNKESNDEDLNYVFLPSDEESTNDFNNYYGLQNTHLKMGFKIISGILRDAEINNDQKEIKRNILSKWFFIMILGQLIVIDLIAILNGFGTLNYYDENTFLNFFIGGTFVELTGLVVYIINYIFSDNKEVNKTINNIVEAIKPTESKNGEHNNKHN
jgi:hypothetical protein